MIHTKRQLMIEVGRFLADKKRGISVIDFAEACGTTRDELNQIFLRHVRPLSETMQRRVSKAFQDWQAGRIVVMQRRDRTRFIDYKREKDVKPKMVRRTRLTLTPDGIKISLGVRRKADYSQPTFAEQMEKK